MSEKIDEVREESTMDEQNSNQYTENETVREESAENTESEEVVDQENTVDSLQEEYQELKNKYLRLYAEFDNFKKRSAKERIEMSKMAGQEVIKALLPVLDDFDRAKKIADDSNNKEEYFSDGVKLVYQKLKNTLRLQGLREMDEKDNEFNPELHEAITEIPVDDESLKGKIVDYIEKGYYLNDKIIRHAKVVTGKK